MPSEHYYKENRDHSSELIPFSYYKSQIPDYFPNVPLHWHKEFELNYILSGQGEFIIGDEKLQKKEILSLSLPMFFMRYLRLEQRFSDMIRLFLILICC